MRIAIGMLAQEVNTFSPVPTVLKDFEAQGLFFGEEIIKQSAGMGEVGGFIQAAREAKDVALLPTIAALADVKLDRHVDGMDLSHNLLGTKGNDRKYVLMSYKKGFFVRDAQFRLHEDGTLYDIPITSDKARYSEKKVAAGDVANDRKRLQATLDRFMAIEQDER